MNTKYNLVISGIVGGVIGSLLTALLVSAITPEKGNFGVIECKELRVVNSEEKVRLLLSGNANDALLHRFKVSGEGVFIGADEDGGYVTVRGGDGKPKAQMYAAEEGGFVSVIGKDALMTKVSLEVYKNSGVIHVNDEKGRLKTMIAGFTDEAVTVSGKAGLTIMGIGADGGFLAVEDSDGNTRAFMGLDEAGKGVVTTWDKERKRLK